MAVLVQLVLAVVWSRGMFFGVDSIEYITHRGTVPGDSVSLFAPWAGHWQTVPILVFKGLFSVFGFKTYLPTILVSILLHSATTVLTYLTLVRVGAAPWPAVAATWLLAVVGAGSEVFLWEGPMPIALCMCIAAVGAFLLAGGLSWRRLGVTVVLLVVGVMSSGAIIGVTVFLGALVLVRGQWRQALVLAGLPMILLATWLLTLGREGGRVSIGAWQWASIPQFVWHGLGFALDTASGLAGAGAVLLVVLVLGTFLLDDVPLALRQLAVAGVLGATTEMVLVAVAGMRLGIQVTESSRYSYIALFMLTPAVAVICQGLRNRVSVPMRLPAIAATVLLLALYTVNSVSLERVQHEGHGNLSRLYVDWFLGNRAALAAGERILTRGPGGDLNYGVDAVRLSYKKLLDALPSKRATPLQRLQAEAQFYVGVGPKTYGLFRPTTLRSTSFQTPVIAHKACDTYMANTLTPSLEVTSIDGVEIGVTSQSSQISAAVRRDGRQSDARQWRVKPGEPLHVATTAKDATLVLSFDVGGEYTICTG